MRRGDNLGVKKQDLKHGRWCTACGVLTSSDDEYFKHLRLKHRHSPLNNDDSSPVHARTARWDQLHDASPPHAAASPETPTSAAATAAAVRAAASAVVDLILDAPPPCAPGAKQRCNFSHQLRLAVQELNRATAGDATAVDTGTETPAAGASCPRRRRQSSQLYSQQQQQQQQEEDRKARIRKIAGQVSRACAQLQAVTRVHDDALAQHMEELVFVADVLLSDAAAL